MTTTSTSTMTTTTTIAMTKTETKRRQSFNIISLWHIQWVSTRWIAYPEGTSWYKQSWPDVSTPTSWRGQKISRHFLFINIFYVVFHFLFKCTIALRGQKGLWPFRLWVEVFWQEATPFGKDQFRGESKLKWPPQPHLSEKGENKQAGTPGRILMQNILRQNTVKQRPWWYFGARQHKQGKIALYLNW